MSAYLTEEHLELQRIARKFSEQEVEPIADKLDQAGEEIPLDLIKKMADLGFLGITIPEEYGGAGLDATALCVVTEELSKGWLSVGSLPARNVITGMELLKYGTKDQIERYMSKIATGEFLTASSGTEPTAGSDAKNLKTVAKKAGNKYVLNGTKMWTTHADQANLLFVYALTDPDAQPKHRGISCFMVEKEPGSKFSPPQLTGSRLDTVGYRGMHSYMLYFDDLEVPEENLLGGEPGKGFYQLMAGYEIARIQFAFRCIGLAKAAYEKALAYSQQREQFGQKISNFQAMRFRLAEMATEIEAARQLGFYAADLYNKGKRCDLEAGMAKLYASEMAMRVTWGSLQMHGGNGYSMDNPTQRYWRDSGLLTIGEGTSEIQKEVIARRLLQE